MNDLDVFGIGEGDPDESQQLSLVRRPPSWFDFDPLWQRLMKIKPRYPKTEAQTLAALGAVIKDNKNAKAPTITGLTWEALEKWEAEIKAMEEKSAEKKAEKEKPKEKNAEAKEPKPLTLTQLAKEIEKLVKQAEKKGYAREDVLQQQKTLEDATIHGQEAIDRLALWIVELEDISPAALKKAMKQADEKKALEAAFETEDRIGKLLDRQIENPFSKKLYTIRDVLKRFAKIESLKQIRKDEYEADMKQLEDMENGWNACYKAEIEMLLINEFKARRYVHPETGEVEFKPATIKLNWVSAKRQSVKGGPHCEDRERFKLFVDDLKKPEVRTEFLQSLTPEQKVLFGKCFKQSVSIDWNACEIAVRNGVKLPNWIIQQKDDIGTPKLHFSKPRGTAAPATPGEEEE